MIFFDCHNVADVLFPDRVGSCHGMTLPHHMMVNVGPRHGVALTKTRSKFSQI